jgi:hypothetical protein
MRIPCKSRRDLNIVRWSAALLAVSGITYALTPVAAQAGGSFGGSSLLDGGVWPV